MAYRRADTAAEKQGQLKEVRRGIRPRDAVLGVTLAASLGLVAFGLFTKVLTDHKDAVAQHLETDAASLGVGGAVASGIMMLRRGRR